MKHGIIPVVARLESGIIFLVFLLLKLLDIGDKIMKVRRMLPIFGQKWPI
jgi:hypothetical protein